MISMTATLPRIHDRPTSSQLASSVVVVESGERKGGGEGGQNGGHGLVSPPIPAGLRLPAGGRTFSPSCPRCAAARIMFSTPRALSGFTSAILETALK